MEVALQHNAYYHIWRDITESSFVFWWSFALNFAVCDNTVKFRPSVKEQRNYD
jgi:hypothetical protein